MQDLKVRAAWVHFPVEVTVWILLFRCDSVESTESIELKAIYGKTQIAVHLLAYSMKEKPYRWFQTNCLTCYHCMVCEYCKGFTGNIREIKNHPSNCGDLLIISCHSEQTPFDTHEFLQQTLAK